MIKVCRKKFSKNLDKFGNGLYKIGMGLFYLGQIVLIPMGIIGAYWAILFSDTSSFSEIEYLMYRLSVPMLVFGVIFGIAGVGFAHIFGCSVYQKLNQKFKIIGWNEEC